MGNLTQQREFLEEAEEWWRRVARPIAEKMGLNLDEFIAMMYEKNSDGDWREFGDEAVKLKWIDHLVDRIWEMSIDKNPGRFGSSVIFAQDELHEEELGDDGGPSLPYQGWSLSTFTISTIQFLYGWSKLNVAAPLGGERTPFLYHF